MFILLFWECSISVLIHRHVTIEFHVTKGLNFLFYLILINLKFNSNSDTGLVATIFDSIEFPWP